MVIICQPHALNVRQISDDFIITTNVHVAYRVEHLPQRVVHYICTCFWSLLWRELLPQAARALDTAVRVNAIVDNKSCRVLVKASMAIMAEMRLELPDDP